MAEGPPLLVHSDVNSQELGRSIRSSLRGGVGNQVFILSMKLSLLAPGLKVRLEAMQLKGTFD